MEELKWIEDVVAPETSNDAIELLRIINEFEGFPSNFINSRGKRMDILISQKKRIINIDYTITVVADAANHWLVRLDNLIGFADTYGKDHWHQKNIRKLIRTMKKDIYLYPIKIINSESYWFNCSPKDIMKPWKEKTK